MDPKAMSKLLLTSINELLEDSGASAATRKSILAIANGVGEDDDDQAIQDLTDMLTDLKLAGKFNESKFNKFVKFISGLEDTAKTILGIARVIG